MGVGRCDASPRGHDPDLSGGQLTGGSRRIAVGISELGLPYIYHPDEPINMVILHRMIAASDLNLGFFQVSLAVILLKFTLKFTWAMFCEVVGRWPVAIHHAVDGEWLYGQPEAFRAARITTLLFGLATLPVLIIWARTILVWMAGFLMLGAVFCLNPLLLRDSTYISPDILAGFFTTSAPVRQYAWFAATVQLTFSRASWQVWRPLRSITPVSLLWRFRPRT